MEKDKLPDTLRMLVDRMETYPDEFINPKWNPVEQNAWDEEPFNEVRWGNIIRASLTTGRELLFAEQEVDFIKYHYRELLRKRIDECIVKELVGGERVKELDFKDRQMDLPYASQSTMTLRVKP